MPNNFDSLPEGKRKRRITKRGEREYRAQSRELVKAAKHEQADQVMKADTRRPFTYRGVTVTPQEGKPRYFGAKHGQYLRQWWRVLIGPMSWILVSTKAEARIFIRERT